MHKLSAGQALLVILLIMSVVLTVVLSVASRSVTEVKVSGTEEDSLRAFSAAEAGVEEALLQKTVGTYNNSGVSLPSGGGYEAIATENVPSSNQFTYPEDLVSGEVATFWLVSHTNDGQLICNPSGGKPCFGRNQLDICWGNADAGGLPISGETIPAVEVMLFYDDDMAQMAVNQNNYGNVEINRFAYDPDSSRSTENGFDGTVLGGCNFSSAGRFAYSGRIIFTSFACNNEGCPLLAKVRVYYSDVPQKIGMQTTGGANAFPAQGIQISSSGTSGDAKRNLNVFQSYGVPPSIFDSALFSPGDLDHMVY